MRQAIIKWLISRLEIETNKATPVMTSARWDGDDGMDRYSNGLPKMQNSTIHITEATNGYIVTTIKPNRTTRWQESIVRLSVVKTGEDLFDVIKRELVVSELSR